MTKTWRSKLKLKWTNALVGLEIEADPDVQGDASTAHPSRSSDEEDSYWQKYKQKKMYLLQSRLLLPAR